jgi:hypothetical protein
MRDTSLVLPADVRLGDAATYRWWVTARLRDGTETTASPRAIQFRR